MARPTHHTPLPPHPRGTPVKWTCQQCGAKGIAFPGADEDGIPYRPRDFTQNGGIEGRAWWTGTRERALCGACSSRSR